MTTRPVDRFPLVVRQQVRWGDMDALGHVNNAVYFTWCESARIALLEHLKAQLGGADASEKEGPAVVSASCDFKKQVRHPADVDVGVGVARVGGKSFTLTYGIFEGELEVAAGSSVVVWLDYAAEKALALDEALRSALGNLTVPDR